MNSDPKPDPVTESCSLLRMRPGDAGCVAGLTLKNGAARRLAEFGFVRGARVEMIRPGAPCIVRLDQTRVSLGMSLQAGVILTPEKRAP